MYVQCPLFGEVEVASLYASLTVGGTHRRLVKFGEVGLNALLQFALGITRVSRKTACGRSLSTPVRRFASAFSERRSV